MKRISDRFSGRKLVAGVTPTDSAGLPRIPANPFHGHWRAQRLDRIAAGTSRGLGWDDCADPGNPRPFPFRLLGDPKHVEVDAHGDTVVARPARRVKTLIGVNPSRLIQEITA
jgi:hypothetical protein